MKSQITIEVPEGKVAKQVTNPDGSINITFVDKEPIRSKSWEEFCKNHPVKCTEYYICNGHIESPASTMPRSIGIRTITTGFLETKEDAEGILALIQLTRLHDEWVGDWEGDYIAQDATIKHQIVCSENEPFVSYHHIEHSLLDFPNEKMAKEFLECFKDLIVKAKKFI